jgi:hypothetical protein
VKKLVWIFLIGCMSIHHFGWCQSTIFSVLQDPLKLADKSYGEENYLEAIELYENSLKKNPNNQSILLKLGQSYYHMKEYENSILRYNSYMKGGEVLPLQDMFYYAEAQSVLSNYPIALNYYKQCLNGDPDNDLIAKKIWQLSNIHYLYEDSASYAIRPVEVNTKFGELSPVPFQNGIVFTSNRKRLSLVDKVDGKSNTPFYKLYMALWKQDTSTQSGYVIGKIARFAEMISSKYNTGPVAFYEFGNKMVFVASADEEGAGGDRTLGIYFATQEGQKWKYVSAYPFNSDTYSISDVTISEDGTKMYFSSNMKGGIGGKDIYSSQWVEGKWTAPSNIGELVNTSQDEVFPYLHSDGSLYFSSNGHPGIGELDIFKVERIPNGYSEPQNVGYPLNSRYDDFGLSFDSLSTHGYFSSNRRNGGYDDDIYEFEMNLQTYPFTINGIVKYKEQQLDDQSPIQLWSNVKIILVDSWLDEPDNRVYEGTTDKEANFSITIPYFSKYFILIIDEKGNEHKASLEIPKNKVENNVYEIVVVRDIFKQN